MKNCEDSKTFEQAGYGIRADSFADRPPLYIPHWQGGNLRGVKAKALGVPSSSGRE